MYEPLLYPARVVEATLGIRTLTDAIITAVILLVLWHISISVKSKSTVSSKILNIVGNWVVILVLYIIVYSLSQAGVIATNTIKLLQDTLVAGIPWVLLTVKAGDVLEALVSVHVKPEDSTCLDINGDISMFGGLVIMAYMIPVDPKTVYILFASIILSILLAVIAEKQSNI